jgi:hypothetical protein
MAPHEVPRRRPEKPKITNADPRPLTLNASGEHASGSGTNSTGNVFMLSGCAMKTIDHRVAGFKEAHTL